MNKNEIKKYIYSFNGRTKQIASSKESAQEYLKKAGIHTPSGKLTSKYTIPKP